MLTAFLAHLQGKRRGRQAAAHAAAEAAAASAVAEPAEAGLAGVAIDHPKPSESSDVEVGGPPTPTRGRESLASDEAAAAAAAFRRLDPKLKPKVGARPKVAAKRKRAQEPRGALDLPNIASRTRQRAA